MPSSPELGSDALSEVEGAQLQRIDAPHPNLFAFTLHRRELHGVLVVALAPRLAWGWVETRPRGEPASAFVQQLRKHLEGARVTAARSHAAGATLELRRGGEVRLLHFVTEAPNVILEFEDKVVGAARLRGISLGEAWPELPPGPAVLSVGLNELAERGPKLVDETMGAGLERRRRLLKKAVTRQTKKLRRRLDAIAGDLARVEEVAGFRHRADLLLANLHNLRKNTLEAVVTDWTTGSPMSIPIRAGRTVREEAEALYGRAGKLERGGSKALEREALTQLEVEKLESLAIALEQAEEGALDGLERAAQRLGVATRRATAGARKSTPRLPYRKFFGSGERPILVGRSAADNDALTQSARAWDHWFHARSVRGSHVVVPLEKREDCPPKLLIDAAHLAAHHSAMSGEPLVEVQHCARRHVRKPKGFAVGAVLVEREQVISLRLEADRLARLIKSEER